MRVGRWHGLVLGIAAALALVMLTDMPARAGVPSDQLRSQIERVLKVLDDPALKTESKTRERRAAVRKIAEDIFDFTETAKRALGRHWAQRSQGEKDEFVGLFADLLERSYLSKIELYGGEKIAYTGDSIDGDQASVKTKIVTKQGTEIPIEYRMLRKADRWLVYDVIIEGVSLISNYRTQFNKVVQTESYQALVQKLRAKETEPAASAAPRERRTTP